MRASRMRSIEGSETETIQLRAQAAFPKAARLLKTDEYSSVFRLRPGDARRISSCTASRPAKKRASDSSSARSMAPRAVTRNLIKRLAREAFRLRRAELGGWDILLRLAREDRPQGDAEREIAAAQDAVPRRNRHAARPGGARSGAPRGGAGGCARRSVHAERRFTQALRAMMRMRYPVRLADRIETKARSLCKRH